MMPSFVARIIAGAVAAAFVVGIAALPQPSAAQGMPSYGHPSTAQDETLHGRIEQILGPYSIVLRDDRGFLDTVTLRQGTIINPRGLRLAVGMIVTIAGYNAGSSFAALEIDAPYDDVPSYSGGSYYDDYGWAPLDAGFGVAIPIIIGVIPPAGTVPAPAPSSAPRRIERPTPGDPVVRRPYDPQPNPGASSAPAPGSSSAPVAAAGSDPGAPLPSYALPLVTMPAPVYARPAFGVPGGGPMVRGPVTGGVPAGTGGAARQSPQSRTSAPESRAPAPVVRSAPAARSEPSHSESGHSAPSHSESSTRTH